MNWKINCVASLFIGIFIQHQCLTLQVLFCNAETAQMTTVTGESCSV